MSNPSQDIYNYYGCALPMLPEETMALGMTLQIKVMDKDGAIGFHEFSTGLTSMEQLGMLESASDTVRACLMRGTRKP